MLRTTELETRALRLNTFGTLGMALLGLGFALITKSEAILLDGFFSLIGFAIALLTQKVSRLVMRPGNEHYPFGYIVFEPMLNLSKGLLIGSICIFALISAISALFTGGRPISAGIAISYACVAAAGCFGLAWRVRQLAQRSGSSLAAVDAQNWLIDGFISFAVAVAFLVIQLTQNTPISRFAPYADPVLVILLVVCTISIPLKISRDAWRQIVGYRPNSEKVTSIHTSIAQIFELMDSVTWQVKSLEIGRLVYVQVYIVDENESCGSLRQQDLLREQLYSALSEQFTYIQLDMIFTQQHKWIN
ncbi:MAG: cation transporter [Symploca sp. SIO3E6]|nr:cation transporter [Caldora sp. SIO3E6]